VVAASIRRAGVLLGTLSVDGRGFVGALSLQSVLMAMTRRAEKSLGMSLVELMIVVVIIGILAAISVVGYRKYVARARLSEATAMLAEFAAKEQLYFLDNGQYIEAHNSGASAYPSVNEAAGEFWPQPLTLRLSTLPAMPWRSRPADVVAHSWYPSRWNQLFCTYMVNAGAPPTPPTRSSLSLALWAQLCGKSSQCSLVLRHGRLQPRRRGRLARCAASQSGDGHDPDSRLTSHPDDRRRPVAAYWPAGLFQPTRPFGIRRAHGVPI